METNDGVHNKESCDAAMIGQLRNELAKANERVKELEEENNILETALIGAEMSVEDEIKALNKFAIEKKIEALESCIDDNAMDNDEIDALIIYVDDVKADIEQLRKEQSK